MSATSKNSRRAAPGHRASAAAGRTSEVPAPAPDLSLRRESDILRSTATEYERALTVAVLGRLNTVIAELRESGLDERSLGEPVQLAERMVASIPRVDPFNLELGPFYTTSSLTKWLEVSRQYIHELTRQRRILALSTADNFKVYPSFQFSLKGAMMPHLADVLTVLEQHLEPWTQAMWFVTEKEELHGRTPAQWLMGGGEAAPVVQSAREHMELFAGAPTAQAAG